MPRLSGRNSTSRRCINAIRWLPATRPGTVRKLSVITWTFGSIPRMRICRDASVAAVGP